MYEFIIIIIFKSDRHTRIHIIAIIIINYLFLLFSTIFLTIYHDLFKLLYLREDGSTSS